MFESQPDPQPVDHHGQPVEELDLETALTVQRILNRLAADQEAAAAEEASHVPYWKACPDSVRGSRAAARALRAVAESLVIPVSILIQ